jgi:hypothetical protein
VTGHMRSALEAASKHPLRRVHDGHGKPPWPAPAGSLAALVRRGWLERSEGLTKRGHKLETWTITEIGKEALRGPRWSATEKPIFMARGGGVTSERARAIDDAEKMDHDRLSLRWRRESLERSAGAEDPRRRARRLARSARRAA